MNTQTATIENAPVTLESLRADTKVILKTLELSDKAIGKGTENKVSACDAILDTFRTAYDTFGVVPFQFWQDICEEMGFAHDKFDAETAVSVKIVGEKPHKTLSQVASRVKKYFEKERNLNVESFKEVRKALEKAPATDYVKASKAYDKLSSEERFSLITEQAPKLSSEERAALILALQ
tara:strand:+ start:167 stop:703 length:537 start_codon:yes stop_codon:yes gene_type:complete